MAVTLIGEVVNSCDATTGFTTGNISGDDDFVEGTGAIGAKISATTTSMYTTSLGATAPYDFQSGGGEFGYHIIMWFNTKTPINATTGLQIVVGNGTSRGRWNVVPAGFYKGGFITAVVNTARNFDVIAAGTWTTNGNPAQLSTITQMGGCFTTTTTIMGSFNNCQLDQFTIGLGVRVDAGTVGSPNTFETVRAQDEGTSFWGWWSSKNGAFVGKGKLYIGPATGSATSVFTDSAFTVVFANERVATGFYEISTRGAGTDVTWTLANISSALASAARWSLTIDSTTNSFLDTNGVWRGADQLTLYSTATLTGTSLVNCTRLTQNGATLSNLAVVSANNSSGVAFILANNPALISGCKFTFSAGHAIECATPGTYSFANNTFTNYGADNTNTAAFYNNCTPTTADTYSETNQDSTTSLTNTSATSAVGQSFTGNGGVLSAARFYLKKTGSPTGTAVAKIYAHSGTFGTSSVPTGAALATSETLTVSTLTGSYALTSFKFKNANNITLTNTVKYVVVIEYSAGSPGNSVDVGRDASSPTHGGNLASFASSTWTPTSGQDVCFYVYTGAIITLNITGSGNTPTVRNAIGCTTNVNVSVAIEVNGVTEGTRCLMIGSGGAYDGIEILAGYANSTGKLTGTFAGSTPQSVIVKARNSGIINAAIQEDNGTAFTDYTTDARDKTGTNDVLLLPASIAVNDAFYFGGLAIFEEIQINITTAGSTYVLTWEYWNGAWTALSVSDGSSSFTLTGWRTIDFTAPSDWATTTINSQGPFYYIRARVTTGGGTQPAAEEISLYKTTKYQPFESTGTIAAGSGLTSTAVWIVDSNAG